MAAVADGTRAAVEAAEPPEEGGAGTESREAAYAPLCGVQQRVDGNEETRPTSPAADAADCEEATRG